MKRIFLFIVTNLAVLVLLGLVIFIIEHVFGVRLGQGGVGGLLVFAAICGFGGAFISLALSKWTAKHMMSVRVIVQPQSEMEVWLVGAVERLAGQAPIAMPEVGNRRTTKCRAGRGEHRPAARHAAAPSGSGLGP